MTIKHFAIGTLLLAGCTNQLGSGESHGHLQQEMRVTADDLAGWASEGEWIVSPALDAPDGASRAGIYLGRTEAGEMPRIQVRALENGAPIGDWVDVVETWGEEDMHVGIAELGALGDGAQLRIAASDAEHIAHFRWNAVIPEVALEPIEEEGDLGAAREALRSELRGLGIVTREAWGARATRCSSRNSSKSRMAIHHTVTPSSNPARMVRGIQRYHMDSRGWCDVGYHFLIGIDGSIYEGRPLHLLGAHVGGQNTGNIGISYVGCFNSSGCGSMGPIAPTSAMVNAGGRLVGELSRIYGITLDRTKVKGHREHSGQSTSCPGDRLLPRIPDLLSVARAGGGSPPPPPPPPPPAGGGSCNHSYGGTYANTACSAGYQCCDGRWRVRGSGCGACLCVEESGRTGCTSAGSSPPPSTAPAGASCTHSYGGSYANTACSPSYQCCDGTWRTRGSCGSCFCVESTGRIGCGAPAPTPPPGASCAHTYGGTYANTACSPGYQCCDGRWRVRGSSRACGACFCEEATGRSGCGT